MKIIKISFSNINNLKGGPHVISFEENPLSSAGLFAILGPTGSGKSTILDVITLALFNRIPRFKKAISKGEMSGLGSVLTHHTNEANAQIEYSINDQRYISKWEISKTRTGKLKDYEMSLQKSDGSYFDLKKSEVPAKNESIIGLEYDQFIKSIILSQGEFSKFLKADKNERGQLLENITGTKIYRKIGSLAYQKHKEIKAAVELELSKLGEIQILNEEERKAIEQSTKENAQKKKGFDKNIQALLTAKTVKQEMLQLNQSLVEKNAEQKTLVQSKIAFQKELSKLTLHEKISPLQADITNYKSALENKVATEKNLANYEKSKKLAKDGLSKVINQMADLTKEKISEENFLVKMAAFEKEINQLDSDLAHLKNSGVDLRKKLNLKVADYSYSFGDKTPTPEILKELSAQQKELSEKISKAGLKASDDLQLVKQTIKIDQNKKEKLGELKAYYSHKQIAEEHKKQSKAELLKFENQIEKTIPLAEQCMVQFQSLKEIETLLAKQKEDAIKIASLSDRRKELSKGEPCPLCGSLEHPYSEHLGEEQSSKLEAKINKNKADITAQEKKLKDLKTKLTSAEASKKITTKNLGELEKASADWLKKIEGFNKENKTISANSLAAVDSSIQQLTLQIKQQEEGLRSFEMLKINAELDSGYGELQKLLTNYQKIANQRKSKYTGDDPTKVCNELQNIFNKQKVSILENNKAIEIESKDLLRAKDMLEKTSKALTPKAKQLGFSSIESLQLNLLSDVEFQSIKQEQENLIKSESAIQSLVENLKKNHALAIKKDQQPELSLEAILNKLSAEEQQRDALNQLIGNNEAQLKQDDALRKRRTDKQSTIDGLNKKLERWSTMNKIIGDATGSKFANFAQGLTLQNLLVFTNKRLLKLSDRYLLDQPGADGSLRVIDQYQGNIQRAVTTLSGGETFLISLALALSLSDMASKNVALESLFIDEGFGTLDQDTLDIALNTLEKLQSESQKTVGVISHVEALKERINVQIKLSKNAQGYSKIVIEGAG